MIQLVFLKNFKKILSVCSVYFEKYMACKINYEFGVFLQAPAFLGRKGCTYSQHIITVLFTLADSQVLQCDRADENK